MNSEPPIKNAAVVPTLNYVWTGPRSYRTKPFPILKRPIWEFFAVLQGRLGPYSSVSDRPTFKSSTLWLHPPNTSHGWKGDSRPARIVVFHFHRIPPDLEQVAGRSRPLSVSLTDREKSLIHELAQETLPHFLSQDSLLDLHAQRLLTDLALIFLKKNRNFMQFAQDNTALTRVEVAENCYKSHLSKRLSLTKLAVLLGTNDGNLRKLFREVRNSSPKEVMRRLQMERAVKLLTQSDLKVEAISSECGFSTLSSFSTIFKQNHGMTPQEYRTSDRNASRS